MIFAFKLFNASALSPLSLILQDIIHHTTVEMFHNLTFFAAFHSGTTEEETELSFYESTPPHHAGRVVVCIFPPHFPVLSESVKKVLVVQVHRVHPPVPLPRVVQVTDSEPRNIEGQVVRESSSY